MRKGRNNGKLVKNVCQRLEWCDAEHYWLSLQPVIFNLLYYIVYLCVKFVIVVSFNPSRQLSGIFWDLCHTFCRVVDHHGGKCSIFGFLELGVNETKGRWLCEIWLYCEGKCDVAI